MWPQLNDMILKRVMEWLQINSGVLISRANNLVQTVNGRDWDTSCDVNIPQTTSSRTVSPIWLETGNGTTHVLQTFPANKGSVNRWRRETANVCVLQENRIWFCDVEELLEASVHEKVIKWMRNWGRTLMRSGVERVTLRQYKNDIWQWEGILKSGVRWGWDTKRTTGILKNQRRVKAQKEENSSIKYKSMI